MNTDLLHQMRDHLHRDASGFDMTEWLEVETTADGHWCGTSFCLAGLAVMLGDPGMITLATEDFSAGEPMAFPNAQEIACDLLFLDPETAERLFFPWLFGGPEEIPASRAVEVIDHLIETGDVNWN